MGLWILENRQYIETVIARQHLVSNAGAAMPVLKLRQTGNLQV